MRQQHTRAPAGQGLVEVCVGLVILVPLLLAAIDLGMLVVAGNTAANLTFEAARAIASLPFGDPAVQTTIDKTWAQAPTGTFTNTSKLTPKYVGQGTANPQIEVSASVDIKLPVPVPFINKSTVHLDIKKTAPMLITAPPKPAGP